MYDDRSPDSTVRYRTDGLGRRVALLPATCKVGTHALHKVGYRIDENPRMGVVRVSCNACNNNIDVDHFWVLSTSGAAPDHAELDDEPYRRVVPVMVVPHVERSSAG